MDITDPNNITFSVLSVHFFLVVLFTTFLTLIGDDSRHSGFEDQGDGDDPDWDPIRDGDSDDGVEEDEDFYDSCDSDSTEEEEEDDDDEDESSSEDEGAEEEEEEDDDDDDEDDSYWVTGEMKFRNYNRDYDEDDERQFDYYFDPTIDGGYLTQEDGCGTY